jgi:hypothetical protein
MHMKRTDDSIMEWGGGQEYEEGRWQDYGAEETTGIWNGGNDRHIRRSGDRNLERREGQEYKGEGTQRHEEKRTSALCSGRDDRIMESGGDNKTVERGRGQHHGVREATGTWNEVGNDRNYEKERTAGLWRGGDDTLWRGASDRITERRGR